MTTYEADYIAETIEKKWLSKQKRTFLIRMERKIDHRERLNRT